MDIIRELGKRSSVLRTPLMRSIVGSTFFDPYRRNFCFSSSFVDTDWWLLSPVRVVSPVKTFFFLFMNLTHLRIGVYLV